MSPKLFMKSATPGYQMQSHPDHESSIDGWIDLLPLEEYIFVQSLSQDPATSDLTRRWMVSQCLPQLTLPTFDGSAIKWVEFVIQFKSMVHDQPYLSSAQRMSYLVQHLEKEAKRAVQGLSNDWYGYVMGLQRLKFMFGQRASVAQSHLEKVTRGKEITDEDFVGLLKLYYNISDCLLTLSRLGYYSDLLSTDVLRQTIRRLPQYLQNKWCERSYHIRRTEEPTLVHLESWLQDRIMAKKDPYVSSLKSSWEDHKSSKKGNYATGSTPASDEEHKRDETAVCIICSKGHFIFKCDTYLKMKPKKRLEFVRVNKLCFNCLRDDHVVRNCKSRYCYITDCGRRHHTTLHDAYEANKDANTIPNKDHGEKADDAKGCELVGCDKTVNSNAVMASVSVRMAYLKVVPVMVQTPKGDVRTYAFLDDGSESSFIREDFAKTHGIKGLAESIIISTITNKGEKLKCDYW